MMTRHLPATWVQVTLPNRGLTLEFGDTFAQILGFVLLVVVVAAEAIKVITQMCELPGILIAVATKGETFVSRVCEFLTEAADLVVQCGIFVPQGFEIRGINATIELITLFLSEAKGGIAIPGAAHVMGTPCQANVAGRGFVGDDMHPVGKTPGCSRGCGCSGSGQGRAQVGQRV